MKHTETILDGLFATLGLIMWCYLCYWCMIVLG